MLVLGNSSHSGYRLVSCLMSDDEEKWARAKLRLALSLMTQYQRDRFNKLVQKHALKRGLDHARQGGKMGRPKTFQGHVPGHTGTSSERIDVC